MKQNAIKSAAWLSAALLSSHASANNMFAIGALSQGNKFNVAKGSSYRKRFQLQIALANLFNLRLK